MTGAGVVLASYRMNTQSSPTAGTGFTGIALNSDFLLTEYKAVSSGGAVSATIGTGAGNANGGLVDVLNPAGAVAPCQSRSLMGVGC